MKQNKLFRLWFFIRQGYSIYFSFAMIGINTLTVTYFLAIEKAPFLKIIFPSFEVYVAVVVVFGVPLIALAGYTHWRKVQGHRAEAELATEINPYMYRLPPGYWRKVIMPYYLLSSQILMKIATNEKPTESEKNELTKLQKDMEHLNEGGYVGVKGKTLPFGSEKKK